ncbi:hypothetical protein RA28_09675 [Ruegeria sp. ANG-S4]|uniref:MarR family winged helix-turn-helix transcriptional regulator n=1 Tax=Ruegeria sp. ANG-S4 TaxID=1577904 RepID=UPI00057E9800|nr:MarR family transcriptional regulator [Ruegeria sp. ANG-S4]KIC45918.1 hypothetical protein RA28_09675 [Ruegeria sp. ANG-S4]
MDQKTQFPDSMFLVDVDGHPDGQRHKTLSFSRTPSVLLTFAANRFTRSSARVYMKDYGIGAMDWRMLVMLVREPGCSAARASAAIGIDKGAISRSLARLEAKNLVEYESLESDERRKKWFLSKKGMALHDEILEVALARLRVMLDGFSEQDIQDFNRLLQLFMDNMAKESLS